MNLQTAPEADNANCLPTALYYHLQAAYAADNRCIRWQEECLLPQTAYADNSVRCQPWPVATLQTAYAADKYGRDDGS